MAVVDHLETLSGDVVGIPSVLPLKAYVSGGLGEKKKKKKNKISFVLQFPQRPCVFVCERPAGRMTPWLLVHTNLYSWPTIDFGLIDERASVGYTIRAH